MSLFKYTDDNNIDESQIIQFCEKTLPELNIENKRVLAIIPDATRTAPIDIMFRIICQVLGDRVRQLDFLIALGTHPAMSDDAINSHLGITTEQRTQIYNKVNIYNHQWTDSSQLKSIGKISAQDVENISNGLMKTEVDVTINKLIFDYDALLIIGPTFPHEVVGFSGGNKYLFPGISGKEIIDLFHWLGALISNPKIIGIKDTPTRKIVEKAASLLPIEKFCISMVVKNDNLLGLYIGSSEQAWAEAADHSRKVHIEYKKRSYTKVLSCAPKMYADLWTGGKCMYKLEPVVADGGELIIYAPHITEVSVSHGDIIEEIGYHVRDYFLKQWSRFSHIPGGVLAHSTHVKGIGTFENGIEKPRINLTLATNISESICKKINMGYRNPNTIQVEEWQNREDEGILYVPKAGEILHRLIDDPF